jgi:hypothetical protein
MMFQPIFRAPVAQAEAQASNQQSLLSQPMCSSESSDKWLEKHKDKKIADYINLCTQLQQATSANANNCPNAMSNFNKYASEFKTACTAAGISDPVSGGYACAGNMKACQQCNNKKRETGEGESGFNCQPYDTLKDDNQKTVTIKYCPAIAGQDLKKWQDEVQKLQSEVNTAKGKIPALQQKMTQVESDLAAKKSELSGQSDKADTDYQTKTDQIIEAQDAQSKAILQSKRDLQTKYDSLSDEIQSEQRSKEEAYQADYVETVRTLKLQCHASSLTQLADLRKERLQKIAASAFSVGGFTAMTKQMGLTDYQRDQNLAYQFYKLCVADTAFSEQSAAGYAKFKMAKDRSDDATNSRKKQQEANLAEQNRMQTEDIPDALKSASRKIDAANKEWSAAKRKAATDRAAAEKDAQNKRNGLQQEIDLQNQEIAQKEGYLNDKMALLKAKELASGGNEVSAEDKTKLFSSFSEATANAHGVLANCKEDDISSRSIRDDAIRFLKAEGEDPPADSPKPIQNPTEQLGGDGHRENAPPQP